MISYSDTPANGVKITGLGTAVPEQILTNQQLEDRDIGTNDQWIVERTGIRERRIQGVTSTLAVEAGRKAILDAECDPSTIDLLVLATSTPDHMIAPTASAVAEALGLKCGAFDLNTACTGFVYALVVGSAFCKIGAKTVLCIGSDTLSSVVDPQDRNTAILFGDGAGAVILEASEAPSDLLGWHLGSDGSAYNDLFAERGSTMQMNGKAVFKKAVLSIPESAEAALKSAELTTSEVDLFILHQANERIIDAALERMSLPKTITELTLDVYGNTSTGSIPLTLEKARSNGRLKPGTLILLTGFGAGMTSASAVIRWSKDD